MLWGRFLGCQGAVVGVDREIVFPRKENTAVSPQEPGARGVPPRRTLVGG